MDNNILKIPTVRNSLIIFILAIVVIFIVYLVNISVNSAQLSLTIAPKSSTVTIDDHKITSSGTVRIKPGDHTIKITKDGFEEYSESFTISQGETKSILVALVSNDPSTANWYLEHEEDSAILDQIGSIEYDAAAAEFNNNYPIAGSLPYLSKSFSIHYSTNTDYDFTIRISTYTGFRNAAIDTLNTLDSDGDAAKYHIEFTDDYQNPFAGLTGSLENIISSVKNAKLISTNNTSDKNYQYALISYYDDDELYLDTYRVILKNGTSVTSAGIILLYEDYPDIPKDIIKQANGF